MERGSPILRPGDRWPENRAGSLVVPRSGDFSALKDHLAFYAGPLDECTVDGEKVRAQPGAFYGGWITSDLTGPFKGGPTTQGW